MIQTSYFARAASLPNAVAISQGIPTWYNGARYKRLAPSWEMIYIKDPELYKKRYCVSKLDPKQVASDLDGCVLLCHEKDSTHCHRRIVAEWLEAALGIKVPEMGYAVRKMPNLWDYEKKEEQADDKIERSSVEKVFWEDSGLKADRSVEKLKVIYNRPGEYPDLGLNLYAGCSHNCWYCYKKRDDRYQGPYDTPAKGATLQNIENDLLELRGAGDIRPVFISVFCDPYDMGRKDDINSKGLMQYFSEDGQKAVSGVSDSYTRSVLKTFWVYEYPFYILTKGGTKAVKDFDLYTPQDKFGVTLTFDNDADSKKWEPWAALPGDRIAALKEANKQDIRTWVSIEPVIYPEQSMNLIERTNDFVDLFCVGKLNRNPRATWTVPEEWPTVDWPKFRNEVEALLQKCGKQPGIGYRLDYQLIDAR